MNLIDGTWTCREVLDAYDVDPTAEIRCEFCNRKLRWLHIIEHEEVDRPAIAGCCCAAKKCNDYDAVGTEREYKNRYDRRTSFVTRGWAPSKSKPENICRFVSLPAGRHRVTIFVANGRYGYSIVSVKNRPDDKRTFSRDRYGTQAEAKVHAFEMIEQLKAEQASEGSSDE